MRFLYIQAFEDRTQIVGKYIVVVAARRVTRLTETAAVIGYHAVARFEKCKRLDSNMSPVRGQPWISTTGCPDPISLT